MFNADAKLIIADSESNADLFYATRFLAGDPFVFIETKKKKIIIVSALEFGRAKRQAKVDEVIMSKVRREDMVEEAARILKKYRVEVLAVSESFPYAIAKALENKGFSFSIVSSLFPERKVKSKEEVRWIEESQRAVEKALHKALVHLRAAAKPTSESVRETIDSELYQLGYEAKETIVAGGVQAADPHEEGKGPLKQGEAIVIDIFPRGKRTRYFADMTRTVCKGKPSAELERMFNAVLRAQELALSLLKPGAVGKDIQKAVEVFFEKEGFPKAETGRVPQGFIHGVGHGLGLEIHESPILSDTFDTLQEGNVVTVEPGLYYPHIGGVRIEDMVLITKNGFRNLTNFPKRFLL